MNGILFKQTYKPKNLPSTPVLNVKHLTYIATRPGVIPNPQCGFGLWGRLPGVREPELINDLRTAGQAVRQASPRHTLWRAILSVDGDTAQTHGLYERGAWEALVNKKIGALAKEMGIRDQDFCWVAAMHYAKGHPHVHILYWDKSDTPHQEAIPPKRFQILAERIRAEWNRELFREELAELRTEKKELDSQLRLELKALLRDANVSDAFSLRSVSRDQLDELGGRFLELVRALPPKGALKYKLLPEPAKAAVNAFLDPILRLPDFTRLSAQYLKLTEEISALYGNGEETRGHNLESAREALSTNLGNELLRVVKDCRSELESQVTADSGELRSLLSAAVAPLLSGSARYQALLAAMPELRTPMWEIKKDPAFTEQRRALVGELADDFRIRALFHGYRAAVERQVPPDGSDAALRTPHRALGQLVDQQLQEDAGYDAQARIGVMTNVLLRLFSSASRGAGQMSAQRDLLLHRSRELSEAARRDLIKRREREGSWSQEL